ncbi:hypothetical protein ACS0TY_027722 [Phlomoides rotata]
MKEQKFESYSGCKIALDASMRIYQFLSFARVFSRTIRLLVVGTKPVYVFDGKPPDLKRQQLVK